MSVSVGAVGIQRSTNHAGMVAWRCADSDVTSIDATWAARLIGACRQAVVMSSGYGDSTKLRTRTTSGLEVIRESPEYQAITAANTLPTTEVDVEAIDGDSRSWMFRTGQRYRRMYCIHQDATPAQVEPKIEAKTCTLINLGFG